MAAHTEWMHQLSDYADGELTADAARDLEAHLADCAECRAASEAVQKVKARGATLVDREPPAQLWASIAAKLPPQPLGVVPGTTQRRKLQLSWTQVAAAAVVLVGLSGSAAWFARGAGRAVSQVAAIDTIGTRFDFGQPTPVRQVARAVPQGPPPSVEMTVPSFDSAMTDLRAVLAASKGRLRPETVKVLEANLKAIDAAIADARRALKADPESAAFLNPYLQGQMTRRLELMRHAAEIASAAADE